MYGISFGGKDKIDQCGDEQEIITLFIFHGADIHVANKGNQTAQQCLKNDVLFKQLLNLKSS